jgi:hypothetical protein
MCRALCFLALSGLLLTPGFGVQDPPGGPPVALAVKVEGQRNPNYVAGKTAYLHIQAVDRTGMPSPINGDAVVVKITDPRNRLNGREVGFVNGKIVLKLQWFIPSKGHAIEVASKSGLRGGLSGIRVDPLPKGTKLSIEDPKPWARYLWSGGMVRLRVKASDENDDPVEHVQVSLRLSKGARVFPHGYYTEDDTGIASGVIFPPEFICPGDERGGGTVNGDAPLKLQAFIDVNGNGDIDDGEPIVEPPPADLVSSCPQVLLPAALELLRILEEGGTLEPPPENDVIVVGLASTGSVGGQGKGKALGKTKPETLTDRELAKIRAARRFLEDEIIGYVNSGKWNGNFSQVRKRVEHVAKVLSDVAPAEPVVHRLECAAKLMEDAPDVKRQKLNVQARPGSRIEVLVGSESQFEVQNLTAGNRVASPDKFPDCFKPGVVQATTQGNGSAAVPDPDQPFVEFECLGPGNVQLTTTTEFKPMSVVVLPPPDNGVVAASAIAGPDASNLELLSFRLDASFLIVQNEFERVRILAIQFNHKPGTKAENISTDALDINEDCRRRVLVPEWTHGYIEPKQSPATYSIKETTGKEVTILVKAEGRYRTAKGLQVRLNGTFSVDAIPDAPAQSLLGIVTGVLTFKDGLTDPEFQPLTLARNRFAAAGIDVRSEFWFWTFRGVPWDAGGTTDLSAGRTAHRIYTVLELPKAPWNIEGRDSSRPWVKALEPACNAARGKKTISDAAAQIPPVITESGKFRYDTSGGGKQRFWQAPEPGAKVFALDEFLTHLERGAGKEFVNCVDNAGAVCALINVLGGDSKLRFKEPFGYLNYVTPLGRDDLVVNTLEFANDDQAKAFAEDPDGGLFEVRRGVLSGRPPFGYHA